MFFPLWVIVMADGRSSPLSCHMLLTFTLIGYTEADAEAVNQARAMRIAELMTDFRNIQTYMASIRANPSAEDYNEEGYQILRRCVSEAQSLLSQPFHSQSMSSRDEEQTKLLLRRYGRPSVLGKALS